MKASLAAFEAKDDEPLKQQNAHLQQQVIELQEQSRELQNKLKKAKEVCYTDTSKATLAFFSIRISS